MRVFVTGATGLIGRRVVEDRLARGDDVVALSRDAGRARRRLGDAAARVELVEGDAMARGPWQARLAECDAVVHLAGAGVADKRWNEAYKRLIVSSRLDGTRCIVQAIEPGGPRVLVNASAVGYYGACGDRVVDESAGPGDDFLAELAVRWEAEAMAAESRGARVVCLRTGMVLDNRGGVLPQLAIPFKLFVGGPVGSGRQYMPWIHWRDEVGLVDLALRDDALRGPLNAVAPNPVTNREFSRAMGAALRRPSWLPVPPVMLRLALGELGKYAAMSQRVIPAKAERHGYAFVHPRVHPALESLLRRS